jgi:hypothetical protein
MASTAGKYKKQQLNGLKKGLFTFFEDPVKEVYSSWLVGYPVEAGE